MADALFLRLAGGLALSAAIGLVAARKGALTRSGVVGAVLIGTLMFGFGGFAAGLTLIAFFVSSSLLSRANAARKASLQENYAKGPRRDLGQALANGGAAAALCVAAWFAHSAGRAELSGVLLCAMLGALATSNGDTWATEIGGLSHAAPRLAIPPFPRVEAGASGGVTALGTAAALGGAILVGIVFVALRALGLDPEGWQAAGSAFAVITAAEVGGLAGAMFDSILGATVQGRFRNPATHQLTEKAAAPDGTPYPLARGWRWMTNDGVNFVASLAGAAAAALMRVITG